MTNYFACSNRYFTYRFYIKHNRVTIYKQNRFTGKITNSTTTTLHKARRCWAALIQLKGYHKGF